jgi:ATP-binding cassette, subfamily B, multidrug efflux pump
VSEQMNGQAPSEGGDDIEVMRTTGREARHGGQAIGSAAMPVERSRDARGAARRLGEVLSDERPVLAFAGVLTVCSVVLLVLGPWLLGGATDIIVSAAGSGDLDSERLRDRLIVVTAVYAAAWAFGYGQTYIVTGAIQRSMYRLRGAAQAKLHRLPLAYVDAQSRGDLLSRVTNDIDNVAQSLQQTISQMLTAVLTVVGVTIVMLTISPLLTLVAFATIPLSIWATKLIAQRARPQFLDQWRATGELNGQAEDVITGHVIVTTFGRRGEVRARFAETNDELYRASRSAQFAASLMQPIMGLVANLQFVSIAVVGGLRIAGGQLSIGDIQAMLQYARQFSQPLQQMASMTATVQSGLASLERVLELLDADEVSPDAPAADKLAVRGRVVFEDVAFGYSPGTPLISGLSLTAEPGETVAIVGPTGAGKTTLVNLLLRFYEIDGGRITLDGRDITTMPRRELRSAFGMVLQDTWLFGGTILDNLRYGNPSATDEEVFEAARVTFVDRIVHSLPDGYETVLNDEADNISAGQKQLITIARAFLADPAILILDEATSSVDTRTEMQIQEAMNALRANRTSFVIAHRLSTIRGADTIVVMDQGRIVEQGDHDSLVAGGGTYAALYAAQFAGHET